MALIKRTDKDTRDSSSTAPQTEQPPQDCETLTALLADTNPLTRRQAAQDIVDCPNATRALLERLTNENSTVVRQVILTSLTRIGDQQAVDGLAECLRSEDARLRNDAIEAMKQLPDQVATIVEDLLHDPDPDVRIFTVNILESLKHAEVEHWLIDVIENDQHINVVGTAVDLLGEVGTQAAVPALQALQQRYQDEHYILFASGLALQQIQQLAEPS